MFNQHENALKLSLSATCDSGKPDGPVDKQSHLEHYKERGG